MIAPEFWGDALPPVNQRYQLDAAIVDRDGRVLTRARPVSFYLRQVAGAFPRPYLPPPPVGRPMPLPTPGQLDRAQPPAVRMEKTPPAKPRQTQGLLDR